MIPKHSECDMRGDEHCKTRHLSRSSSREKEVREKKENSNKQKKYWCAYSMHIVCISESADNRRPRNEGQIFACREILDHKQNRTASKGKVGSERRTIEDRGGYRRNNSRVVGLGEQIDTPAVYVLPRISLGGIELPRKPLTFCRYGPSLSKKNCCCPSNKKNDNFIRDTLVPPAEQQRHHHCLKPRQRFFRSHSRKLQTTKNHQEICKTHQNRK